MEEHSIQPTVPAPVDESTKIYGISMADFRALLVKILLGCLITAAGVAVVAVLIGSMTDVVWRAIGTIAVAILHIAILFGVVSIVPSRGTEASQRSTNLLINATIIITVCSFFTAVLNVWDIFDSTLAMKLYVTYFVTLVSLMHVKVLIDAKGIYAKLRPYVLANYAFVIFVAGLILGAVYADSALELLNGFYGRLLAASAIIDVTLSMVVAVMQHLYLQKHPELRVSRRTQGSTASRIVVAILLFIFVGWPLISIFIALSAWR